MKQLLTTAVLFFSLSGFSQTRVYLVPTLHGLHKLNQQYNYDSLKANIERIHPDLIAVEIRGRDVHADTNYLKKNYPYEMWMMRYWFPSVMTDGFDWLGEELETRAIPDGYWKEQSQIKALERQLDNDSVYAPKLGTCGMYTEERMKILKSASLPALLQSRDAALTVAYYNCMKQQLEGSSYGKLLRFYEQRNRRMQQNLSLLVKKHPSKTIVVLTGDDHYPYLHEYLEQQKVALEEIH